MSRIIVVVAAVMLAIASVAVPVRTSAPSTPTASGCNDPRIGGYVGSFATCDECEFTGWDGASQGVWTTWHCRLASSGWYDLYAT